MSLDFFFGEAGADPICWDGAPSAGDARRTLLAAPDVPNLDFESPPLERIGADTMEAK
jgi:hypothetical protein